MKAVTNSATQLVLSAAKSALFSLSPSKCLIEPIVSWDFKIGNPRENLMRLCFSGLSAWLLLLAMIAISFDPFQTPFSADALLASETVSHLAMFFFSGYTSNMLIVFGVVYVVMWLFRAEALMVLLTTYLVKHGLIHINLATAAVLAVLLSRICYLWWPVVDIKSETKKIWNRIHQVQMLAWLLASLVAIYALDYLQINRLLSDQYGISRTHFLTAILILFYFIGFIFLSLWGHFYFNQTPEPSHLTTYYSTAHWILRFKIGSTLQRKLKAIAEVEITKHQNHLKNFAELKATNPALANLPLENVINSEIQYLKEALLRLSKA